MPDSPAHFRQAQRNLKVVAWLNSSDTSYWDWQITTLFYSALHLINGHIVATEGTFYNSHAEVRNCIHWQSGRKASLPREIGLAYEKLQLLSRKARYLYDPERPESNKPQYAGADSFEKAVYAFDKVYRHIAGLYGLELEPVQINCAKAGWNNRTLPL